ncbi:MAG: hypothetical protein GWP09_02805 [Nitrospiraceae bacterium]|nr:hypothetical protein [Nitrospiraceae bacterium]
MFYKKYNGFTLIETIGAISILLIGIIGTYAMVRQSLSSSIFSRSHLIASYLGQEGVAIVRNIRDTNWLQGNNYDDGLADGDYEADYTNSSLGSSLACSPICTYTDPSLSFLKLDNGFYDYNSGTQTIFKRKISLEHIYDADSNPCLKVTITVYWKNRGERVHQISVQENLYDWYY